MLKILLVGGTIVDEIKKQLLIYPCAPCEYMHCVLTHVSCMYFTVLENEARVSHVLKKHSSTEVPSPF